MSKGVPISQRPDLKDASLTARLDAVFGALGPAPAAGGWSLRQDVQPFRAGGGIEEYNYSSDEEDPNEGLKPLMPSRLVDSDEEGADGVPPLERADPDADAAEGGLACEQNEARAARERERMRASLSSRRAFEAEAEEDEFDRFATGTMDPRNRIADARPPGFTEVPLESAWERMHSQRQQQQQHKDGEDQQQQSPDADMLEAGSDRGSGAAASATATDQSPAAAAENGGGGGGASRKRSRTGEATAAEAEAASPQPPSRQQQSRPPGTGPAGSDVAAGDVEMLGAVAEDRGVDPDAPGNAPAVSGHRFAGLQSGTIGEQLGVSSARGGCTAVQHANGGSTNRGDSAAQTADAPPPPRQRGGRRVQWADFVAAGRSPDTAPPGAATEAGGARPHGENGSARSINGGGGGWSRGRGGAGGGSGGRVRLDWQRRGFVPDHVRNPHKYTMYTLDEELVVGGGDRPANGRNGRSGGTGDGDGGGRGAARWQAGGSGGRGDDEMRQALAQARRAVEASSGAEHDPPERAETSFGSGIAFRSRAARQQQQEPAANAPQRRQAEDAGGGGRPDNHSGGVRRGGFVVGADVDGEREELEGGPHGSAGAEAAPQGTAATGGGLRGGGRRHFRARSRRGDDEGEGAPDGAVATAVASAETGVHANGDAMQQD